MNPFKSEYIESEPVHEKLSEILAERKNPMSPFDRERFNKILAQRSLASFNQRLNDPKNSLSERVKRGEVSLPRVRDAVAPHPGAKR